MPKPTPRQVEYLQKVGIEVPPTRIAASSIIEMIEEGNRLLQGMNRWQKIALFKSMQNKWIGKRVVTTIMVPLKHDRYGTVLYLRPYRKREMIARLPDLQATDPFQARVRWDDGSASGVVLHTIKLAEEE